MRPSKLLRHMETKHPTVKDKPLEFFERKKHEEKKQLLNATTSSNVSALRTSLLVADHITKMKKSFTTGEELVLPAAKNICCGLLGKGAVQKEACAALLAGIMLRWVDELAEVTEAQLLERVNESPWYATQVDKSTSVDNKAIILVFIQYIFQENVHKYMLCVLLMSTNTTTAELFISEWLLLLFQQSVMSDSLWPHGLQQVRLSCPSPSPTVCSNSCPLSLWCHPTISSSVAPFASCPQSLPASGSFPMSRLFELDGQSFSFRAWSWSMELQLQHLSFQQIFRVYFL